MALCDRTALLVDMSPGKKNKKSWKWPAGKLCFFIRLPRFPVTGVFAPMDTPREQSMIKKRLLHADVQNRADENAYQERNCGNGQADKEHLPETFPEGEIFCHGQIKRKQE